MAPIEDRDRDRDRDREHDARQPNLYQLDKQMAVVSERIISLTTTFGTRFDSTDRKLDDVITRYATKDDVEGVKEDVKAIRNQIAWGVKIVVGIVLAALVGLVVAKNGLPHT